MGLHCGLERHGRCPSTFSLSALVQVTVITHCFKRQQPGVCGEYPHSSGCNVRTRLSPFPYLFCLFCAHLLCLGAILWVLSPTPVPLCLPGL